MRIAIKKIIGMRIAMKKKEKNVLQLTTVNSLKESGLPRGYSCYGKP
jgi:hypothetical protein